MLRVAIAVLSLARCAPAPRVVEVSVGTTALPHAQHALPALHASIVDALSRDDRVVVASDGPLVEPVVVELAAVPNGRHGLKVTCRVDAVVAREPISAAAAVTTAPTATDLLEGELECLEIAGFDLAQGIRRVAFR